MTGTRDEGGRGVNLARLDPGPNYRHLQRLTDGNGLFEHALFGDPRPEHGYCLDDVARALVVTCREPRATAQIRALAGGYLDFTLAAIAPDGACHNRMATDGRWCDEPGVGDWWGRALWGLGVAAVAAPTAAMRARAVLGFRTAARRRSPDRHAMAFAALGAGELLLRRPMEASARAVVEDAVAAIGVAHAIEPACGHALDPVGGHAIDPVGGHAVDPAWPWPEPRLRYASGAIVEALILAGAALPDGDVGANGLALLDFLVRTEIRGGRVSATPVTGRGVEDTSIGFDQQPIEVAALADACARAFDRTSDDRWRRGVESAWAWFTGDNDSATPMFDPLTGAGFDGLQSGGCNQNQGAESTLAFLATAQQAQRLLGRGMR